MFQKGRKGLKALLCKPSSSHTTQEPLPTKPSTSPEGLNLVLVGDRWTGKTGFRLSCDPLCSNHNLSELWGSLNTNSYKSPIVCSFCSVHTKGSKVDQDKFFTFQTTLIEHNRTGRYRDERYWLSRVDGLFAFYDITRLKSFDHLNSHIQDVSLPQPTIVLGTHNDEWDCRQVEFTNARSWAIHSHCSLIEVNLKEMFNIRLAYTSLCFLSVIKRFPHASQDCTGLNSPLFKAVAAGKLSHLSKLVDLSAKSLDGLAIFDHSLLTFAAVVGDLKIVKFLISKGCNSQHRTLLGETPLLIASRMGHEEVVKCLLSQPTDSIIKFPLHQIVFQRNILLLLLQAGFDPNFNPNDNPLRYCYFRSDFDQLLLHFGYRHDTLSSPLFEITPLMVAAGLSPNILTPSTDAPASTDVLVVHQEDPPFDILDLLVQYGANVNQALPTGETALYLAALKGDRRLVQYLLQNGAKIDDDWKNPVIATIKTENYPLAEWLLPQVSQRSISCCLFESIRCDRGGFIPLLLRHGADLNFNLSNFSPLMLAAARGRSDLCTLLLQHGANPNGWFLHRWNNPLVRSLLSSHLPIIEKLLEAGAVIDEWPVELRERSFDCLFHAVSRGDQSVTKIILSLGEFPDCSGDQHATPLLEAVKCGHHALASLLVGIGCCLHQKDDSGRTPLGLAAAAGDLQLMQLLLDAGADPNFGTPLIDAVEKKSSKMAVVDLLLKNGADPRQQTKSGKAVVDFVSTWKAGSDFVPFNIRSYYYPNSRDDEQEYELRRIKTRLKNYLELGMDVPAIGGLQHEILSLRKMCANIARRQGILARQWPHLCRKFPELQKDGFFALSFEEQTDYIIGCLAQQGRTDDRWAFQSFERRLPSFEIGCKHI